MTLLARPTTKTFFCVTHQTEFSPSQLEWVLEDRLKQQCPRCVAEIPAEFAREIGGKLGICAVHDKEGVPAVERCITCHNALCGDCMSAGEECVFCMDAPYGSTRH